MTIIPVGRVQDPTPEQMGRLPGLYPLVGLVVGLAGIPAQLLAEALGLPPLAQGAALVALMLVLTRGFHLDGLADAADALLSHKPVERKLEILKDSHLGTFGVAAIVLDALLKASLLAALCQGGAAVPALALYPVLGRLTASAVAVWGRNARTVPGLGYYMVEGGRGRETRLAAVSAALVSLVVGPFGLLAALAALVLGWVLVRVWKAAIGGVTGDLLGASVELGELLALLILTIRLA